MPNALFSERRDYFKGVIMDRVNEPKVGIVNKVNHDDNIQLTEDTASVLFEFTIDKFKVDTIDLNQLKNQGFSIIQTVFIDNSLNSDKLILTVNQTNQVIKCPAYTQGYFPILATNNPKFKLTGLNVIPAKIKLYFLNFILSQGEW